MGTSTLRTQCEKIRFFIELEMEKPDFIAALSKRAQHLMRQSAALTP